MKMEMFFVYPMMGIVNGESNLFRIVDNDLKESIIIYLMNEDNKYSIYMMNTMTGDINILFDTENIKDINNFNDNFLNEKNFILKGIDLGHVEKYILTIYKS